MKNLTLAVLLLCGLCGFAQTGSIQITVNDTIWIKTLSYDYEITMEDMAIPYIYADTDTLQMDHEGAERRGREELKKQEAVWLKDIETRLTKAGLSPKPIKPMPTALFDYNTTPGYRVTIKNTADALRVAQALKGLNYAAATTTNFVYEDPSAAEERLMKKLVAHGLKKAGATAAANGQTVGKALEIIESDAIALAQLGEIQDYGAYHSARQNLMVVMPGRLIIKFTLE